MMARQLAQGSSLQYTTVNMSMAEASIARQFWKSVDWECLEYILELQVRNCRPMMELISRGMALNRLFEGTYRKDIPVNCKSSFQLSSTPNPHPSISTITNLNNRKRLNKHTRYFQLRWRKLWICCVFSAVPLVMKSRMMPMKSRWKMLTVSRANQKSTDNTRAKLDRSQIVFRIYPIQYPPCKFLVTSMTATTLRAASMYILVSHFADINAADIRTNASSHLREKPHSSAIIQAYMGISMYPCCSRQKGMTRKRFSDQPCYYPSQYSSSISQTRFEPGGALEFDWICSNSIYSFISSLPMPDSLDFWDISCIQISRDSEVSWLFDGLGAVSLPESREQQRIAMGKAAKYHQLRLATSSAPQLLRNQATMLAIAASTPRSTLRKATMVYTARGRCMTLQMSSVQNRTSCKREVIVVPLRVVSPRKMRKIVMVCYRLSPYTHVRRRYRMHSASMMMQGIKYCTCKACICDRKGRRAMSGPSTAVRQYRGELIRASAEVRVKRRALLAQMLTPVKMLIWANFRFQQFIFIFKLPHTATQGHREQRGAERSRERESDRYNWKGKDCKIQRIANYGVCACLVSS